MTGSAANATGIIPPGGDPTAEQRTPTERADQQAAPDATIDPARMQEMIAALQKKADEQDALNRTLTRKLETLRATQRQEGGARGVAGMNGIDHVALTFTTPVTAAGGRAETGSGAADLPPLNRSNTYDETGASGDAPNGGSTPTNGMEVIDPLLRIGTLKQVEVE
ncbi:unnamed protein product [Microthlaspi erraticum]|uniref:Uncharacterized protein n=1 Tax=Microthlaspi erraticum TaxID=1685480 RepID=A0A6D2IT32_9BRAS|nr:unnamed protein product [Microthlaspi erraticum]CAA7030778.1 unnamed protein product [Microthlaspi erraticum]